MLLKQTLLYLPAQIVGPAFQFMAVIVWTYWLTPEAYGVVALLLAKGCTVGSRRQASAL